MKRLLISLLTFPAMYLLTAFGYWDLDPSNWSMVGRGLLTTGATGLAVLMYSLLWKTS